MTTKAKLFLKLAVSCLLIGSLIYQVDLSRLISAARSPSLPLLACVVGVVILQFFVGACRWFLLIRGTGVPLSPWQTFRILLAGMFFNQALPGSLSADTVRIWLVSRHGLPMSRAASTVLLDRTAGLVSILTLLVVTSVTVAKVAPDAKISTVAILVVGGAITLLALGLSCADCLAAMIEDHRFGRPLAAMLRDSRLLWRAGYRSAIIIGLSYLLHVISAFGLWVVFQSISVEVDFLMVLGALPLVILGTLLPISVGGWGVREGLMVGIFAMTGMPLEHALAASILWGLSVMVAAGLGGLLWVLSRPISERSEKLSEVAGGPVSERS
ncbi:lysylphosphatidylglycerol synthase transmembrane domain-containing protein [Nisaea sp.]|uniref:lysylphosphatidylglycerol synthase transmembrane domain-containing protein n=1 Tax=Nisaea sp. TaxID=2024842 RepID=UPI0032989DB2